MDPSLKPMLASPADGIPGPGVGWAGEEKFDGWRAVVHNSDAGIRLYGGRNCADYTGQVPYIETELASLLPPDTVIDGELVGDDWGEVQSAMTTHGGNGSRLTLKVFDLMRLCTRDLRRLPWEQRRGVLEDEDVFPFAGCQYVELTELLSGDPTHAHQRIVQAGGEGTVWKSTTSTYQSGRRSALWLKWKHETTNDWLCTGFIPGKGEFAGMVGAIEFATPGGRSTASGMDLDTRKEMTAHPEKWLRQFVEIKHNGLMPSGKPRHPQYLRLRSDRAPAPQVPIVTRPKSTTPRKSGRWMRNYGAMLPDKLLGCIRELELRQGDAYDRVVDRDGDLTAHIVNARMAARKKGLNI